MTRIQFTDGISFDTSGPLRVEKRSDGYYVVGKGMLCAVDTRSEGLAMIASLERKNDVPARKI